ncbi:MAG: 3'-5' exonuclease [Bacteroidetes bacterium GWA2_31_9]|nr:MAG: 3'-5' exonuclease [Bacteroidetes bacterium GWA2_31_9]
MLESNKIDKILFLDIETVPEYPEFNSLPENFKPLWEKKSKYLIKENETPEDIYNRAGIYAEFGKIVCISVGFIYFKNSEKHFRIKSYYNDDEKIILTDFIKLMASYNAKNEHVLCAHNGKEFDFPYLCRRILINDLHIPKILDLSGKKPWEISHLDTLELWKFGDYKHYTSLELLATIFNIPTPKDDIDGSQVGNVYWKDNDLKRIAKYCEKDVLTIAQLLLKYKGESLIEDANIEIIS